jgi:AmiR/NasT family two-component response regulator
MAGPGRVETERVPVVFVSASAADARALRECTDSSRWLVVNVPDLTGARAVIDKLKPGLVVCDAEIEGRGSWRDLLREQGTSPGFALVVASRHADEALWTEVIDLGGLGVLEKPFAAGDLERVIGMELRGIHDERELAAHKSLLHAARWANRGQLRVKTTRPK